MDTTTKEIAMNEVADLTPEELQMFENATSETEWNKSCDQVKRSRNGAYPNDWYKSIIFSGLASRKSISWK